MVERINKCLQSALSVLSTGWNSVNVSSSLLSSSFQPRLFWHELPSEQCQDSGKSASPSGSKGKKMCPFQFAEFEHGRRHGDPSAPELILRPVARQGQGKTVQTSSLGGGHSGTFFQGVKEWTLRAGPGTPLFSYKVTSHEDVRGSREGCGTPTFGEKAIGIYSPCVPIPHAES